MGLARYSGRKTWWRSTHQLGLTSMLESITRESTQSEKDYARHLGLLYESFDREVGRRSWRVGSAPKEPLQCLVGLDDRPAHTE